ncbi:tyrosine-protein kinase JAK1-like [Myxocyprinus asiaticus]|uniref:tyrosine-protein kinase JAK1-like n=1 Tax=Myxocyprinus asiaticus TaxID=70543 RepID=UPI002222859C|nr:tyrosine-protein kinase JAK1-like [Myxocyprinus asiaticus]XP_051554304.1 tyrosine-protein kinase JAK1-like [Myxocyprinus asiaticus]
MDFGRHVITKVLRNKKKPLMASGILQGLEIHFYLPDTHQIIRLNGSITAEGLCVEAAKKLGISPLCSSLFALYDEFSKIWYPPNYTFNIDETTRLKLHYRMRFYFTNWHGNSKTSPPVWRHTFKKTGSTGTAVLDVASLAYLYAQSQCDFHSGLTPLRSAQDESDRHQIENECLGMAVMAISHHAIEKDLSICDLGKKYEYKNYIPMVLYQSIRQRNILTRLRISSIFKMFLEEFNRNTVQGNNISTHDMKVKYLSTLETLTQHYGQEVFEPSSLILHENENMLTDLSFGAGVHPEILVSGTSGIHWRQVFSETCSDMRTNKERRKSKRGQKDSKKKSQAGEGEERWMTFSDFHEITHIVIKCSVVTVYKQDNKKMELHLSSHEEALSFASLVDGYFRLTVDAHHFLCRDVAPVSLEINLQEGCHGPINTEYAYQKLKKEGYEEGMYLLRWSGHDYDHILMTVICKERNNYGETTKTFKNFQIEVSTQGFHLTGTDIVKPTVRELTDHLSGQCLTTDHTSLRLKRGCPPQPREPSNLLVVTRPDSALPRSLRVFHRILKEDIIQEIHLGQGTCMNIYAGRLKLRNEDDEGFSSLEEVNVVLKVLGAGHKDVSAFLDTVSMMRQISHKHMVLMYGMCMHSMDIIMVEEFVQHGPLDLFMRNHRSDLTPSWKFQVAEQLASVLSYLEDEKLVHGYVCAKNVLLKCDGLEGEAGPFIKLSDPGVPITVLNKTECIDRIPWIAPECVNNITALNVAADKWGFGTTLWEICYNGEVPLRDKKLLEKERFYEVCGTLVTPSISELADLISQCMNYDPRKRPFFRAIVRELDRIKEQREQEIDILSGVIPPQETDPTDFKRRFLKIITELGKGNFGVVDLCLYDPNGDQTGELVAVKSLKTESESSNLRREINTIRNLYHENIVKYKGICNEEGGMNIKLIMEYLPAGSLKDYLPRNKSNINHKKLLLYALQICQGMEYLGSQNYIHRDLAARNVLVENESLVKIGDFGLTKSIKDNEDYYKVTEEQDSPVYWYAPECLIHRKFYKASDVWSFGVTLYELMTYCDRESSPPQIFLQMIGRSHGQMTMARLVKALEDGWRMPCPPSCPEMVYTQMRRCWSHAPENRADFKSLIKEFEFLLSRENN